VAALSKSGNPLVLIYISVSGKIWMSAVQRCGIISVRLATKRKQQRYDITP